MHKDNQGIRINKALAQAGFCSRRQADTLISSGRVSVNGHLVQELGLRVFEGDTLSVDGKNIVVRSPAEEDFIYLMLNKPIEVVSTARDPEGRRTVLDLLPEKYSRTRLFPVGRLDYFSEGLLLLTNDGELTLRLTHPSFELAKRYEVLVREKPDEKQLRLMRAGMLLSDGTRLAPVEVRHLGSEPRGELVELVLRQGINRQIRRMCAELGLTILRLRRVAQGGLELGRLDTGTCRELSPAELSALRKSVGLGRKEAK